MARFDLRRSEGGFGNLWANLVRSVGIVAALVIGVSVFADSKNAKDAEKGATSKSSKKGGHVVHVSVFNEEGELVGPVNSEKIHLTDKEWKERLTPDQYRIARAKGTEPQFCGTLLDNKEKGVYTCVGCGLPLFSSVAKFNSGTGWPSFFQPIAAKNVVEHPDFSDGTHRTEILCARCDCHLGHVFNDGPPPTRLRFCLNSESLKFTSAEKLASLADPDAEQVSGKSRKTAARTKAASSATADAKEDPTTAVAVFAGGCFWCTEAAFESLKGILNIESGYTGGAKETANYEHVHPGDTGHAEAIRITYDPRRITYDQLLDVFFDAHVPTELNRQGEDVGTQYRSAIFYANDEQKEAAESKIQKLTKSKKYSRPIVTKLEHLKTFYPAEGYHQDYARRHPYDPYIQYHAIPKAQKVIKLHKDLVDTSK